MAIKRSLSATPEPLTANDDGQQKATPKMGRKKTESTQSPGDRAAPRSWSRDEEKIFAEIIEGVLKASLWEAIKTDGRLEYRGGQGIRAHMLALMKRLKKGETAQH